MGTNTIRTKVFFKYKPEEYERKTFDEVQEVSAKLFYQFGLVPTNRTALNLKTSIDTKILLYKASWCYN